MSHLCCVPEIPCSISPRAPKQFNTVLILADISKLILGCPDRFIFIYGYDIYSRIYSRVVTAPAQLFDSNTELRK